MTPQVTIRILRSLPLKKGTCRGCGAPIEWVYTAGAHRLMPVNHPLSILDVQEQADGRLVTMIDARQSHFVTCPDAVTFRRRTGRTIAP